MVSPVAQMILDLIENQLDEADVMAIGLATNNKLIKQRQTEQAADPANMAPAPLYSGNPTDIYGSADANGNPVVIGYRYRITPGVKPKYLAGIPGVALGRARNTRNGNVIDFKVDDVWRGRCRSYLDTVRGTMKIPGSVLRPFKG